MRRQWIARAAAGFASCAALAAFAGPPAAGISFVETQRFATLPDNVRFPEGIAADPATGDIFVATFDFGPVSNKLVRLDRNGRVSAMLDFGGSPLLGLEYLGGKVYVLNFGAGTVQRVDADFTASSVPETLATLPVVGSPGSRMEDNPDTSQDTVIFGSTGKQAPNGIVFDHDGNAYVSDSFQGAIFEIPHATTCSAPCAIVTFSHDPLLATAGTPPFGANGLAFSPDEGTMYIANTGDHRVLAMDMTSAAHPISVYSISLFGADGLLMNNGTLWVATNQADQVVALDSNGRIAVKAGEFLGVGADGTPRGLLFPASLVAVNGFMYVTNLALPLTNPPPARLAADEPEDFVKHWTISRFRIPH
ncbi:MAG TPA: SMP-30/gluconolactonase/LRE family protein [Usitatibacter sp.]|nr:SMP-30/gluconolactonase/LRE family protein [Usitatibacter sp.]